MLLLLLGGVESVLLLLCLYSLRGKIDRGAGISMMLLLLQLLML